MKPPHWFLRGPLCSGTAVIKRKSAQSYSQKVELGAKAQFKETIAVLAEWQEKDNDCLAFTGYSRYNLTLQYQYKGHMGLASTTLLKIYRIPTNAF